MICHSKTSKRDLIGIEVFMKQMLSAVRARINDVYEARDASDSPARLSSSYTGRAAFACNLYSSVFADAAKLPAASGRKKNNNNTEALLSNIVTLNFSQTQTHFGSDRITLLLFSLRKAL